MAVSEMADSRAVEETLNTPINLVVRSKGGAKPAKAMKADVKDYMETPKAMEADKKASAKMYGGAGLARMVGSGSTGGAMCGGASTGGASAVENPRTELAKKYELLGQQYARDVREIEPELMGGGFWEDFGRGFMMPFKAVSSVAKPFLPPIAQAGLSAVGLGVSGGASADMPPPPKPKTKKPVGADDKRRARGQAVSQLMKQHGLTLAEASKYIKQHGY